MAANEEVALREAGLRLRRAVAAGRYEAAGQHLQSYIELVASSRSGPAMREALELIEETRRAVLAGRAHLADKFAALASVPLGYASPKRSTPHTWELKG